MASAYELPSKEATLFRHLVQNYESKAFKKGLKTAEQILRKHPNHGNTQAMKALILNTIGRKDEAFDLCKLALKNAMKSHITWHVYGLLWRSVKNYEEAIKAYRFALRLDPDSQQIQRDLALLQVQMRDYAGYIATRRIILQARPNSRQNWTALAVAHHLNGELSNAEDVLVKYEDTLKQPPPKTDLEHSEASLYRNTIIQEAGEYERALEHLEGVYKTSMDRTAVMEMKAELLIKLGKSADAEKAYRALLARNAEKRAYYQGLEMALGLDREKAEDQEKLREVYQSYADKSPRIDAARRIPLDFLHGEPFRKHADAYLRRMFAKGVPSTFANVKQLYSDPAKRAVFQELVEGYSKEEPQANGGAEKQDTNGSADSQHKTNGNSRSDVNWPLSVNYFLAQHYNYPLSQDLTKASQYIEKAIELNPSKTDYTYHMTRARILKHSGDISGASKAMNAAREMDLKDRYINTKSAKYQLRANDHEAGVTTMGLFTRKEAVGGPLGDLLDMQCVWYVTEDGLAYLRQKNYGLALKRFISLYDIFEVWYEDQFDFHTFSLRKGMVRAYIDMVRWEDKLREHPFFSRAALAAVQIYTMLHDSPNLTKGGESGQSETDRKKAAKKAKKEAERQEAEKKAKKAAAPTPKATDDGEEKKKEDLDPLGLALLKSERPLEEALKFVEPLLELSPKNIDAQAAGFEVHIRRGTYLPALRCLLAIHALDPTHPKVHELSARFKLVTESLEPPLPEQTQAVIKELFASNATLSFQGTSVKDANEAWLLKHKDSAAHVHAAVRVRHALNADAGTSTKDLVATLSLPSTTLDLAELGLKVAEEIGAGREEYMVAARARWSQAEVFRAAGVA